MKTNSIATHAVAGKHDRGTLSPAIAVAAGSQIGIRVRQREHVCIPA